MNLSLRTVIELPEYEPVTLPRATFSDELALRLYNEHGQRVRIEWPSPLNQYQWRLTSLGWVGFIPASPELLLALRPKVSLRNLFGMLEYAYQTDFKVLPGLIDCATLEEFYDRLAHLLAKRILARQRQGLYRAYVPRAESLAFVRGRLDVPRMIRRPWDTALDCQFEEHTADVEDNQILAWTLRCIAQSGLCTERSLPAIRKAWRGMAGAVSLAPMSAAACTRRAYNRLNHDYQTSHGLCRFFLENSGPTHVAGEHTMFPFLVDMAQLYEKFVAAWLAQPGRLPEHVDVRAQERIHYGPDAAAHFRIDLTLYDVAAGRPLCVLDTKYKTPVAPAPEDVSQVVTYAHAKGCTEAILVYPQPLSQPLDVVIGQIRIRSLTFTLDRDLDEAGSDFLHTLNITSGQPGSLSLPTKAES
ncbi:MAG: restriction endonuclease [Verrucomicrobia bacterium]|nr:restriction endonuclease [Verrucomicrobiota bacterium]